MKTLVQTLFVLGLLSCGSPKPPAETVDHDGVAPTESKAGGSLRASVSELASGYGLAIETRKTSLGAGARTQGPAMGGDYSWDFLTSKDDAVLDEHLAALVKLWPRFTPRFVEATGLRGILFVKDLSWNGLQVYGFELEDSVLLVNLTLGGALHYPGDDHFFYGLVHEFFHLIQNKLHGDKGFIDYDEWDALNKPGVSYVEGGAMAMLKEVSGADGWSALHAEHPAPGFVSRYAMAEHYHDTTETFCSLFVTSRYKKAMKWRKKDRYLASKLAYLKRALRTLDPEITGDFFEKLHKK